MIKLEDIKLNPSIKTIMNEEFLQSFKEELDSRSSDYDVPIKDRTYWNFYNHLEDSYWFHESLEITFIKFRRFNFFTKWFNGLTIEQYDYETGEITRLMVALGIIKEGEIE